MGAETGIGKTSLFLQIAENMALNKNYVIFCSAEMTRKELAAKSISRICKEQCNESRITADKILRGELTEEEQKIFNESALYYAKNIEPYIFIEKIDTVAELLSILQEYKGVYNKKPIVFIDYLQIMQYGIKPSREDNFDQFGELVAISYEHTKTIKEEIDEITVKLDEISREYTIPIFIISSLNRTNYSGSSYTYENAKRVTIEKDEFNTACFKESGLIDYAGDTLLRLNNVNKEYNDIHDNLAQQVELLVLKNRYGMKRVKIPLTFYPAYSYFK